MLQRNHSCVNANPNTASYQHPSIMIHAICKYGSKHQAMSYRAYQRPTVTITFEGIKPAANQNHHIQFRTEKGFKLRLHTRPRGSKLRPGATNLNITC